MAATTWGNSTATKCILLIHGITCSSQVWSRIGRKFASRGYFVTAPDLLGHGNARKGSSYTISTLAKELRPFFSADRPYDIVIGHAIGGVVAAALLPLLKATRPVRVILVDPCMEATHESVASLAKSFIEGIKMPKTPEAYLKEHPLWTKEDATMRSLSVRLCDAAVVEAAASQNLPWTYSHYLEAVPDNVKVTILAPDPSIKGAYAREEDFKSYPRVNAKTIRGASHWIHFDSPDSVVGAALDDA